MTLDDAIKKTMDALYTQPTHLRGQCLTPRVCDSLHLTNADLDQWEDSLPSFEDTTAKDSNEFREDFFGAVLARLEEL